MIISTKQVLLVYNTDIELMHMYLCFAHLHRRSHMCTQLNVMHNIIAIINICAVERQRNGTPTDLINVSWEISAVETVPVAITINLTSHRGKFHPYTSLLRSHKIIVIDNILRLGRLELFPNILEHFFSWERSITVSGYHLQSHYFIHQDCFKFAPVNPEQLLQFNSRK